MVSSGFRPEWGAALDIGIAKSLLGVLRKTDVARVRFQTMYDSHLRVRSNPQGPASFVHAVISGHIAAREGGLDTSPQTHADAAALALAMLGDQNEILEFVASALSFGIIMPRGLNAEEATRLLREALPQSDPVGTFQSGSFEGLTDDNIVWGKLGPILPVLGLVRRRLCRVTARDDDENEHYGTGFLVGPSCVLTNFHVVEKLPFNIPDTSRLRITFNYASETGLSDVIPTEYEAEADWCLASSEKGTTGLEADYWWHNSGKRNQWLESVANALDYAVIRVKGAPGPQRGWFDLTKARDERPDAIWALHHPGTEPQILTPGGVVLTKPSKMVRLFHLASTAGGSSGGLLISDKGQIVAQHHLALEGKADASEGHFKNLNVAVPLCRIAEDIAKKQATERMAETGVLRPLGGCLEDGHPLLGRQTLLEALMTLWRGDKRILMVNVESPDGQLPPSGIGKSFTHEILRTVFKPPEHHHILFRAGEIAVDAYTQACATVASFATAEDLRQLPKEPDTSTSGYVQRLVRSIMGLVDQRLSNKLVWITLDNLDVHRLSDASGREFLATLYSEVAQRPSLRIVLIGLPPKTQIGGLNPEDMIEETLSIGELEGLDKKLEIWLLEHTAGRGAMDKTSLGMLSQILLSAAGEEAPLAGLGRFLHEHVSGSLAKSGGEDG